MIQETYLDRIKKIKSERKITNEKLSEHAESVELSEINSRDNRK